MDPFTAGIIFATKLLDFGTKVYDATPEPLKAQGAGDWAQFAHNIALVILGLQEKANAALGVKPNPQP